MGCDKPSWVADIDHTVPYPLGLTHPSNNVCYCRLHHLLKTFHRNRSGWLERTGPLPDGTMIFTSPTGRVHATQPFGAMLFSATGRTHRRPGPLPQAASPPSPYRGLAMPKRKRTRAQDRANRIQAERNLNAARYAADPPPF